MRVRRILERPGEDSSGAIETDLATEEGDGGRSRESGPGPKQRAGSDGEEGERRPVARAGRVWEGTHRAHGASRRLASTMSS